MPFWMHPSGGVIYHYLALRFRNSLWKQYRKSLGDWLRAWNPGKEELILIGPSGGYSLPPDWLARFRKITVLEPDPIARTVFRKRFKGLSSEIVWVKGNHLIDRERGFEPLLGVLSENPDAAVLFCNVLGQMEFILPWNLKAAWPSIFQPVLEELQRRGAYASFHDRLSAPWQTGVESRESWKADRSLPDAEVVTQGAISRPDPWVITDHLTYGLFSEPVRYFSWRIHPKRIHWIEGVQVP